MPQTPPFTGFASVPQKSAKKGGRRPKEEQTHLPPEEEEKRKQRRARNKEAAARCRKRRLDHMQELSQQVAQLQDIQSNLEREIESLAKEKDELEFVLKTHEPTCRLKGGVSSCRNPPPAKKMAIGHHHPAGITVTAAPSGKLLFLPPVKTEAEAVAALDCDDKTDPPLSSAAGMKGTKYTTSTMASTTLSGSWTSPSSINRPDSLHFRTAGDLDSPGIPIQTPSKIFNYDPLNALSLPTGLTPVTSGLTPILSLANAAASLETPTTSSLGSLDGAGGSGGSSHKALQSL